jgi:hypothetical protein
MIVLELAPKYHAAPAPAKKPRSLRKRGSAALLERLPPDQLGGVAGRGRGGVGFGAGSDVRLGEAVKLGAYVGRGV